MRRTLLLTAALLAGAAPAPGVRLLSGAEGLALLHQCSRSVPAAGEGTWTPDLRQVAVMERSLVPRLAAVQGRVDWSAFPRGWSRRYVGLVRGDRRYLYGDYSPRGEGPVCDGGPAFFGAEWDVAAGRFTHLAFNGLA